MSEVHEHKNKTVVSVEGMKKLEEKLQYLTTVRRAEVAEQISVARGFGDLSENAEYDEAKKEQAKVEEEIVRLTNTIRTAVVVADSDISTEKVSVGTTVRVKDVDTGDEDEYAIVGANESDPYENKISNESPVGHALIGKRVGDVVDVETQSGVIQYKVLDIKRVD